MLLLAKKSDRRPALPMRPLLSTKLTEPQFKKISHLVKDLCGINLHDGKKELVKARLNRHLRRLGMNNFGDYIDFIQSDPSGTELTTMLDALSTNLTSFFREPEHFRYLAKHTLGEIAANSRTQGRRLRIWSAGCASGEEAYSIAITVSEAIADLAMWDAAVLATDLSTQMLTKAKRSIYDHDRLKGIPPHLRMKYFDCIQAKPKKLYTVKPSLRRLVHFSHLNLLNRWPMRGPFDVIFCRNVMIYFDKATQKHLIERFCDLLSPGGVLFIGHSESLVGSQHRFRYVQPTIYRKP